MARIRRELHLSGVVQGVGFRPWAARRARALELAGRVYNTRDGVGVVLEGEAPAVAAWISALETQPPPSARIEARRVLSAPVRGERGFEIAPSGSGPAAIVPRVPPDLALCGSCVRELFDPANRRFRYPFTHCACCGPRASVLLDLPYDRERTQLRGFPLCAACRREYAEPENRRFHAEGIACAACGPQLAARDAHGTPLGGDPVEAAAACLAGGGIVAVKGYGGFHLAVDATRPEAVSRLRKRKARPAKPFAVLLPELAHARRVARLSLRDEALLSGPARAVVVAPRRESGCRELGLALEVAPGIADLGLLLPVAPVHWLLFFAPGARPGSDAPRFRALVFTSANRSGEPTLHDNAAAREVLAGIADLLLEHDRPVARPNDDPVYRSAPDGPIPIRLSRATAPAALPLPGGLRAVPPILALGGDLKCAPALAYGGEILLAEHVGDLASAAAGDALESRTAHLCRMLGLRPGWVVHDLHPEYAGSRFAAALALRRLAVQHHHAHAAACLVEHQQSGPGLALALDGAGLGSDGTIWGGELLRVDLRSCERIAHLEAVRLPGGDAAVREPWRMAAVWLDRAFPEGPPALPWHRRRDADRLRAVREIAARGLHSPWTSSCGRLFDAVASLLDLCDHASHEGEAALRLEAAAAAASANEPENDPVQAAEPARAIPVADLVRRLVRARAAGHDVATLARRFHEQLAARLCAAVEAAAAQTGLRSVVLTGGCLQNRLFEAALRRRLAVARLEPLVHRRVPPNDGGLAVGQAAVAAARIASGAVA